MKRLGVVVLVLVVVLGLAAVFAGRYAMPGPTYTVAEVKDALSRQPVQWAGRTVLVRGVVTSSSMLNMCTSTDIAASNLCVQRQSWMIDSTEVTRWVSPASVMVHARLFGAMLRARTMLRAPTIGANGGAPVKLASTPLYFSITLRPVQELAVAALPGALAPVGRARQILPDAAYTLPLVGPLASRFFPRDGSRVYRVRLLDPRVCAQVTQSPCADAVFAP